MEDMVLHGICKEELELSNGPSMRIKKLRWTHGSEKKEAKRLLNNQSIHSGSKRLSLKYLATVW
jgi:hypothetical protein